jgi:hypothetical protein
LPLRLEGYRHGLLVGELVARPSPLALERVEDALLYRSSNLLKALDGNQSRDRPPFPFDDELVMSESDAIQHVAKALPDIECGDLLGQTDPSCATIMVA